MTTQDYDTEAMAQALYEEDLPSRPLAEAIRKATMKRVWRAQPSCGGAWCYDESLASLAAMIDDGASPGESYEIECVEISLAEWEAVGEFNGW